jgi:hypothetical protein
MATTIITPDDLENFRQRLLEDIQNLPPRKDVTTAGRWLRSDEVLIILKVSLGTLQHLRRSGALPYTKIGNVIYYDVEDIEKMMLKSKRSDTDSKRKSI